MRTFRPRVSEYAMQRHPIFHPIYARARDPNVWLGPRIGQRRLGAPHEEHLLMQRVNGRWLAGHIAHRMVWQLLLPIHKADPTVRMRDALDRRVFHRIPF